MASDPTPLATIRDSIRELLADAVDEARNANVEVDDHDYAGDVRDLAAAYVALGGDLELGTDAEAQALRGQLLFEREQHEALRHAALGVTATLTDRLITAEDFPPRLAALVPPLNALADVLTEQA